MPISTMNYITRAKSVIRNFAFLPHKTSVKPDYDNYVKISDELQQDVFTYIDSLKSTIGNYAKHNNIEVHFKKVAQDPQEVSIDVFAKENPIKKKMFDLLEMAHEEPVKLNKKNMLVKINPNDIDEVVAPSRKVFTVISNIVKSINESFNPNLKKR